MVAIFIIIIHIEIVIFPYFVKKKQIGFERTINSGLYIGFQGNLHGLSFSFEKFADLSGLSENVVVLFVLPERGNI